MSAIFPLPGIASNCSLVLFHRCGSIKPFTLAYAAQFGSLTCHCFSYTCFLLSHKQTTHPGTQNKDNCQQQNVSSTWIYCHSAFSARGGEWVYVFSNDYSLMNCRYCGGISFLKPADRKNFIPNIVLRPGFLSSPNPCAEFPLNPRITVHLTAKRWKSILRFFYVLAAYDKSASIYLTTYFHYALFSFQSFSTNFFASSATEF